MVKEQITIDEYPVLYIRQDGEFLDFDLVPYGITPPFFVGMELDIKGERYSVSRAYISPAPCGGICIFVSVCHAYTDQFVTEDHDKIADEIYRTIIEKKTRSDEGSSDSG